MEYKAVTIQLIDQCKSASVILQKLPNINKEKDDSKIQSVISDANKWKEESYKILEENGLILEAESFQNYKGSSLARANWSIELSNLHFYLSDRKDCLLKIAKEIENKKLSKEIIILTIDDIDNFSSIKNISSNEVMDYASGEFLEDDVEECFLEALVEPYKEVDSGSETRDLFTDKLIVNGKRLSTAIMFKGRGLKGSLSLNKCGSKGNQLLKLAKNNAAECFIVQHVDKIEPDVREALIDFILANTRFNKTYVCFIDGLDTARFLKGMGKNLDMLSNSKN